MNNAVADAEYFSAVIFGLEPGGQCFGGLATIAYRRVQSVIRDPFASAIFH